MYKFGTFDDIRKIVKSSEHLAIDTETVGLYGRIRIAQFYQRGWDNVIIVNKPDPIQLLMFLVEIREVPQLYQMSSYDISTLQAQTGGRYVPDHFDDTFYLARLAYPQLESFSLDDILLATLGFDPYKKHHIDKAKLQKSKWDVPILSDAQLMYAALDVFYLPEAFDVLSSFLNDINYKLDIHNVRKALDFQNNGFPVIQTEVEKQYNANRIAAAELGVPINVNSYKQVREYLGIDASDGLTLATLALQGNDAARKVNMAKKLLKQNSFLEKFVTDDGRIYGKFAPAARSGRYTCKDQNLQQLPRKLKHVFGFEPEEGKVLLYADYPQLELRTIAAITNEKNLIKLFQENGDPHGHVAALLFGPDWGKPERQVVKTYNFNLLYCGGANMVQSILIKDFDTYRDINLIQREKRGWHKAWPAITAWQENKARSHRRGGIEQTPFGRRYQGRLLTDHANIENQGFGADIAKLALHYMYDDLKSNDAMLVNFIHDSYIIEMERDEAKNRRVAAIVRDAMKEAWYEGCKMVQVRDIPMPAEVACGFNWGEIEAGDYLFKVD